MEKKSLSVEIAFEKCEKSRYARKSEGTLNIKNIEVPVRSGPLRAHGVLFI